MKKILACLVLLCMITPTIAFALPSQSVLATYTTDELILLSGLIDAELISRSSEEKQVLNRYINNLESAGVLVTKGHPQITEGNQAAIRYLNELESTGDIDKVDPQIIEKVRNETTEISKVWRLGSIYEFTAILRDDNSRTYECRVSDSKSDKPIYDEFTHLFNAVAPLNSVFADSKSLFGDITTSIYVDVAAAKVYYVETDIFSSTIYISEIGNGAYEHFYSITLK